VADKPVDPNQTVEHDGRRIAFCCGKCKAAFEKEPAKFLAKLPPKK
jgi:YHS domain-containing protein